MLLHVPYFDLYRKQVVKQADLVLAMHWAGDDFTPEEKAANFAYYDAMTVRDSSLSACTQAVLAAEVGHLDLAADYLAEAALMDLHNLQKNASDGLHIASLAGGWLALVAGFGGMRDMGERLTFRPQLAPGWTGLRFRVQLRGHSLHVDIGTDTVTYTAQGDAAVSIEHLSGEDSERLDIEAGGAVTRAWTRVEPSTHTPTQPAGRAPFQLPAILEDGEQPGSS